MRVNPALLIFIISLAWVFAASVQAACRADVDFGTSDPHVGSGSGVPTITRLPSPVEYHQAINRYYLSLSTVHDRFYTESGTLTDNILATDYATTTLSSGEFNYWNLQTSSGAVNFQNGAKAAHPFAEVSGGGEQISIAKPSAFTEKQLDDTDDSGVTGYFLQTILNKTNASDTDQSDEIGTQLLITNNNVIDTTMETFGTDGGAFYRYRDGDQHKNEWSPWVRLDNREIDAQFARVDYLRFDLQDVSVDARTPFSLNLPAQSDANIPTATELQSQTNDISLYLTTKGTGQIHLGSFTNDQPAGGVSNFTYNISIDGSSQVLSANNQSLPLVFNAASEIVSFSNDNIRNVNSWITRDLVASIGATIANLNFVANKMSTVAGTLLIDSADDAIDFSGDSVSDIGIMEAGLDVGGSDTLRFATAQISATGILTIKGANDAVVFNSDVSVDGSTSIDSFLIEGNSIISKWSTENFSIKSATNSIDVSGDALINIGDISANSLIAASLSEGTFLLSGSTINTINSSPLVINPANSIVDFKGNSVQDVGSLTVDDIVLSANTITASTDLVLDSSSDNILFNSAMVRDVSEIESDNFVFSGSSIIHTNAATQLGFSNYSGIDANNNALSNIDSIVVGGILTLDNDEISSTGDIVFLPGGSSHVDFSNNNIINARELVIDGLIISEDNIETSGSLTVESATGDIQLLDISSSNAIISANNNIITNIAAPLDARDAATKKYMDDKRLNDFTAGANLSMQGYHITNLALSTAGENAARLDDTKAINEDITRYGDYGMADFDMQGTSIKNLGAPTSDSDLVRLKELIPLLNQHMILLRARATSNSVRTESQVIGGFGNDFTQEGNWLTSVPSNQGWGHSLDRVNGGGIRGTTFTVKSGAEGYYLILPVSSCANNDGIYNLSMALLLRPARSNSVNNVYGMYNSTVTAMQITGNSSGSGDAKPNMPAPAGFWLQAGDKLELYATTRDVWCEVLLQKIT